MNNEEFVIKTVEVFVAQIHKDVLRLNEQLAAGEWKALSSTAHKIKPNIDLLEITDLKQDIRDIEKTASKNNSEEMHEKVRKVTKVIDKVQADLDKFLKS